jgi:predicted O-methyltransferase YrrM
MTTIDFMNLAQLREDASSQKINEEIVSSINPSSLGLETLQFISVLMDRVKPRSVLEFGSGLSTLFFSRALANTRDAVVYSMDNSEFYLSKTKEAVSGRSNVELFCCPIKPYQYKFKRFLTYDDSYLCRIPKGNALDMILIDGPPGYRYGREAVLYQVAPFVSPKTLILLDDANREPEQTAITNWRKVWGGALEIVHFPELKKGLAVLRIKEPLRQNRFPFSVREIRDSWRATRKIQSEDRNRSLNEN